MRVWRPAVDRHADELSLCGTVEHLPSKHQETFQTGDDLLELIDDLVEQRGGGDGPWEAPGDAAPRSVTGDIDLREAPGDAAPRETTGDTRFGAGGTSA